MNVWLVTAVLNDIAARSVNSGTPQEIDMNSVSVTNFLLKTKPPPHPLIDLSLP